MKKYDHPDAPFALKLRYQRINQATSNMNIKKEMLNKLSRWRSRACEILSRHFQYGKIKSGKDEKNNVEDVIALMNASEYLMLRPVHSAPYT